MSLRFKQFYYLTFIAMVFALSTSAFAQKLDLDRSQEGDGSLSMEMRPFDFRDKFYELNGIRASALINRPNGKDGNSVFDTNRVSGIQHNNIRLLATRPAYGPEGNAIFWNMYGEFDQNAFMDSSTGQQASDLAYSFPVYVFPSVNMEDGERQASIILASESYFETNTLGLGIAMKVEYTPKNPTKTDLVYLGGLTEKNGSSLDGTPIIRTEGELTELQNRGLISVTSQGDNNLSPKSFIVAKVIQFPGQGAIAPDAFLIYVKDADGNTLPGEQFLVRKFNCLQSGGTCGG